MDEGATRPLLSMITVSLSWADLGVGQRGQCPLQISLYLIIARVNNFFLFFFFLWDSHQTKIELKNNYRSKKIMSSSVIPHQIKSKKNTKGPGYKDSLQ